MDWQPLEHRIPGTNTIERVIRLRWFVAKDEDLMAALYRLAG